MMESEHLPVAWETAAHDWISHYAAKWRMEHQTVPPEASLAN